MQRLALFTLTSTLLLLSACNTDTPNSAETAPTSVTADASITISDAWVRENAPGQKVGAAYMTLNSTEESKLVYAEAIEAAGAVEIHSMTMNDGVMKMRMMEELVLEPNKPVSLAPGSFHLMLFDLKEPLTAGKSVSFRLCFAGNNGNITEQYITAPVKSR